LKKLLSIVLVAIAVLTIAFVPPAQAGDAAAGAGIFSANCAACHAGGGNIINPAKTLRLADLEKNGKNSEEAIIKQVTNGAGAMPSFKRLGDEAIANVAAYVLEQADKGW
jgi:cytochrome c6